MRPWLWAVPSVVAVAAAGWLYRDNRGLRAELDELRGSQLAAAPKAVADPVQADTPAAGPSRRGGGFLGALGRPSSAGRPELPDQPGESRAERRQRRQEEMRAMFGREPGESAEDYRARVAPFVQTALAVPRARMEEARAEAEKAARVSEEQRAQIDAVLEDVSREALALTNEAVAAGDLTPYERNYAGVLSWSGGLGAILGTSQARIGEILGAEQLRVLSQQGFEWAEYMGVRVPWESLDPPPPAGDGDL
jgi:hypothetical protein